ncbi:MAG: hypothetical protein K9G37_11985 [Crocinitomicaceae bacterium]|nr:hypothetical protein [Crocinitomicaceae bacterium]
MKEFKKYTGLVLLFLGLISLFWYMYLTYKFNVGIMDISEKIKNVNTEKHTSFEMYMNTTAQRINNLHALFLLGSSALAIIGSILLIGINGAKEK